MHCPRLACPLMAVLLAACSGGAGVDRSDLTGYWKLESIEVDGVASTVSVGVNTARGAWILIGDSIEGSAGCNDFWNTRDQHWELRGGRLHLGEIIMTAALCGPSDSAERLMTIENLMTAFLGAPDFEVALGPEERMVWTRGATRLLFTATDGPVHPPPPPPETGIGLLDCSPGILIREQVADTGIDGEQMLRRAVPEVISVESTREGWFWFGQDQSGAVIAAVYRNDVEPVTYTVFTCAPR